MRIAGVTIAHFAEDLRSIWRSAHPEKRYGSLADLTKSMYGQTPTAQTAAGARKAEFTALAHAVRGLFRIGVMWVTRSSRLHTQQSFAHAAVA